MFGFAMFRFLTLYYRFARKFLPELVVIYSPKGEIFVDCSVFLDIVLLASGGGHVGSLVLAS